MTAALFVPIRVDALAVDDAVSAGSFRRWAFQYDNLTYFGTPMPEPGDANLPGPLPGSHRGVNIEKGVYLHWTLPRALRTQLRGSKAYPLVPNRWLVVRMSKGTPRPAAAWVVESDCPGSSSERGVQHIVEPAVLAAWSTSADPERRKSGATGIDPRDPSAHIRTIGRVFPFPTWRERTAPGEPLFLTAVAASNPVFSAYVPHNDSVFSFFDDLAASPQGPLSYYVVGWYSDPARDVLAQGAASAGDTQAVCEALGWALSGSPPAAAGRSLYGGTVFALDPEPDPKNDPFRAASSGRGLNVAIGNSTIDAFMALIKANTEVPPATLDLFRALQYDALELLNRPGGATALEETARRSWFTAQPGGTRWAIVASAGKGGDGEPSAGGPAWLRQLNDDQADQDRAVADLFALQRQVLGRWIQSGYIDPASPVAPYALDGFTDAEFSAFQDDLRADVCDPTNPRHSAARLVAAFDAVIEGAKRLPVPDSGAHGGYLWGAEAPASPHQLGAGEALKPVAAEPYHVTGDPVVVVSGVEPPPATLPEDGLVVRSRGQLVARLAVGGRVVDAGALAAVAASPGSPAALPDGAAALLAECGLLDPCNATALDLSPPIDAGDPAAIGPAVAPAYGLGNWTQPWEPMFLEWKVGHVPLPDASDGQPCWAFDGTDYVLTEAGARAAAAAQRTDGDALGSHVVGGLSLLGPQAQEVFARRLRAFVAAFGDGDGIDELETAVEGVFGWKFLAQEISGFGTRLALRDPRPFRRPSAADAIGAGAAARSLAELTGFRVSGGALPDHLRGAVTAFPRLDTRTLPFSGSRQGVAWFTSLTLYDKFGRALDVIGDSGGDDFANFEFDIDPALRGGPEAGTRPEGARGRRMFLPPRLLQGARLDFDLIDARDDAKRVDVDASANPVCGFVLPNHLDGSIGFYGPDGGALGEFRLVAGDDGTRRGDWQSVPGLAALDRAAGDGGSEQGAQPQNAAPRADIGNVAPRLAAMLNAPGLATPAGFSAFLEAIDATLWTIDPLGDRVDQNLSVLIGRPLALIRARLAITLDGPPAADPGWVATRGALAGAAPAPPVLARPLSIRLGDRASRHDGVIGYFAEDDFGTFNAVTAPDQGAEDPYVRPIGPLGAVGGNYITVTCAPGDGKTVTILADPRASLHAVAGLLPVRRQVIPPRFVERPLRSIAVGFRLGPVLTSLRETPREGTQTPASLRSVTLPIPTEQRGTWAWWERNLAAGDEAGSWSRYGVLNAVGQARLGPVPSSLREGVFQLSIDLTGDATQAEHES